jgi:hypothetical protein
MYNVFNPPGSGGRHAARFDAAGNHLLRFTPMRSRQAGPFLAGLTCAALLAATGTVTAEAPPPVDSAEAKQARLAWFREAKFGLFIHWGLSAIPAGEWKGKTIPGIGEWIMNRAQVPVAEYEGLAKQWNPVKFNALAWVPRSTTTASPSFTRRSVPTTWWMPRRSSGMSSRSCQPHLGLPEGRSGLEVAGRHRLQARRHREQGRQLPVERRPDGGRFFQEPRVPFELPAMKNAVATVVVVEIEGPTVGR